jgi:hypothetical protein
VAATETDRVGDGKVLKNPSVFSYIPVRQVTLTGANWLQFALKKMLFLVANLAMPVGVVAWKVFMECV